MMQQSHNGKGLAVNYLISGQLIRIQTRPIIRSVSVIMGDHRDGIPAATGFMTATKQKNKY